MPFGDMVQEKQASTQIGKVGGGRRVLHGTTNEVMEDREGGSTDFSVFMPMLCALFDCPGNAQRLVFCLLRLNPSVRFFPPHNGQRSDRMKLQETETSTLVRSKERRDGKECVSR